MARPEQVPHGHMHGKLFRLRIDLPDACKNVSEKGKWVKYPHPLTAGTTVKVVMVSRFGDCGITDDLEAEYGYFARVEPYHLEPVK